MLFFYYIAKELVFPLLLSTGVISTILIMNRIFEFIPFLQAAGLETSVLLQIILYSLPPVLMISVPISLIIGVYAGISRLSSDYELIAMRASGVSLSFFYRPVFFVTIIVAAFVAIQTFYLGPIGVKNLELLKFNILKKQTRINLTEKQINHFFGNKLIYLSDKNGEEFTGIIIADWNSSSEAPVIEAKSGIIELNEETHQINFRLKDGVIHYTLENNIYRSIRFDRLEYDLAAPKVQGDNLPHRYRERENIGETKLDTELTLNELLKEIEASPENTSDYWEYIDELHGRIVTILSCLCFAIFALPMGIFNPRSPKAGNIVYMVLVLIIYFWIYAQTRSMVTRGEISPVWLYFSLVFVVLNGLYRYYKINQNIDSLFGDILKKQLHRKKA